jgi:hypothetical protein
VKQSDLGEYQENAREKQNIQVYKVKHQLPSNQPYGWQTPISPRKSANREESRGFAENVGQLSLGVYVSHLNVSLLYMISQEVVSSLNMSHLFVKD